jgi:hypothetical protein
MDPLAKQERVGLLINGLKLFYKNQYSSMAIKPVRKPQWSDVTSGPRLDLCIVAEAEG